MSNRGLIVYPNDVIDEVDEDGEITSGPGEGIYAELAAAGYPKFNDPDSADCFDISIDEGGQVTAHSVDENPGNREHAMGQVTPRLAAWLALTEDGR